MAIVNEHSNDFKIIIHKFGKYWRLYLGSLALFMILGVLYNKFAEPRVNIGAKIVVHESNRSMIDPSSFLPGSELFSGRNTFQNSLISLNARPLLEKVFDKLNFSVQYYRQRPLYNENLYNAAPFQVILDKNHLQLTGREFYIEILSDSKYKLSAEADEAMLHNFVTASNEQEVLDWELEKVFTFGETARNENFKFTMLLKEGINLKKVMGRKLFFVINSNRQLVNAYKDNLTIEAAQLDATAININLIANNYRQGKDFLDSYVETIIDSDLQRKNHIAFSTIDFIDQQLNEVFDSLSLAEQSLQDFRTQRQVIDVNMKASQIYDNLQAMGVERDRIEAHVNNLEFLNDNFKKGSDVTEHSVTVLSDLNNQVLNDLLNEYIGLIGRKNHLIENRQAKSPQLRELTFQISNLKKTILVNLQYDLDASRLALQQTRNKMSTLNAELDKLPETQRNLTTFERNFRLNDAIYTFLIEKRSEAQIAKASNLPDYEVIDYPAFEGYQAPKKTRNLVFMVFWALLLPTIYILVHESFFEKIADIEDFRINFNAPVLGQIYMHPNGAKNMFENDKDDKHQITAESFRKLRTNLGFWGWPQENEGRIILLTSTMPGEGKSFCSFNLAHSLAALGKKTVLLDFDLRKGDLSENYFTENSDGISRYLSGQVELNAIIKKTDNKNISYIPAGPLPPNPAELVDSEESREMLKKLREKFDYVIVDAGPVSVTAESLSLGQLADLVIMIMRVNYTLKHEFKEILTEMDSSLGKKVSVLLNGVKISRNRYYSYSAYYMKNKKN